MPGATPNKTLALSQSMFDNISMAGDLDMVRESGASAIALFASSVRDAGAGQTVQLLRERQLAVSSIHLGLKILEVDELEADASLRDGISLAASVGAPVAAVSPGSKGNISVAEADARYIRRLSRVAPLARELGVIMGIEPLHPFLDSRGYIHTIRHAARIASSVENSGIVLDVVHLYWDGDLLEDIRKYVEQVALVQVSNLDGDALAQLRWSRARLDEGIVPVAEIVRAVDAAGYRGSYESESFLELSHDECIATACSARLWFDGIWR